MSRVLEVSRSGYYAWKNRPKSGRRVANESLLIDIRRVFLEHDENYGSPRVWRALRQDGIACSENRIARLMRQARLVAIQKRKYRVTTNSEHAWPVAPNIVNRNFVTDAPGKIWLTDITYIWTREGWLYLAFVIDLYCRGIMGLSMAARITDELTQNALKQALVRRNPPEGLIHHSDRGSQYSSGEYQELLKTNKIIPSMSRKGDCWDNAISESFIHTLKVEKIKRSKFQTREEAKREIFKYIEMYYNCKRMHSSLDYVSPFEYEKQYFTSLQTVH